MAAEPRAQHLAGTHDQAGGEPDFLCDQKHDERRDVAGPVQRLGARGGFREVETQAEHEGEREKRSRARAKHAVVKPDAERKDEIKFHPRKARVNVLFSELGPEPDKNGDTEQEQGNDLLQPMRVELLHEQ